MPPRPIRNLTEERRQAAARAVADFLSDLRADLAGIRHRIVEGSAVAAEVRFSEDRITRALLRVDVEVDDADLESAGRTLRSLGFAPGDPSGDVALLRVAARRGRRPIHVIFDDDGPDADPRSGAAPPPAASRPHPSSPEAARERVRRLAGAFRPIHATWRRATEVPAAASDGTVSEEREVNLVGPSPAEAVGRRRGD